MTDPYRPDPTPEQRAILDKFDAAMKGDPDHCGTVLCEGKGEPGPLGTIPDSELVQKAYPDGCYQPERYMAATTPDTFNPATLRLAREANWKVFKSSVRTMFKSLCNIVTLTWRLWRKR